MSEFKITVESPESWQRVIKVNVPDAEYNRQYQQRLAAAVREHKRPGFRKGKTPRSMVEKELGSRLRRDTFEGLVPQAYREAVIEHRLFPINEPQMSNLHLENGEDVSFDLTIEVRPEVEVKDYEGMALSERQVNITDDEVDEVLTRLRDSRASFEAVERAAKDEDQVVLDLVPLGEDGEPQDERKMNAQRLTLGDSNNLPAFNDGLQGVEADQDLDIQVAYPDDYPAEALQGQTMTFRCHIVSVEEKKVPEASDEFAAELQEGQTLEELKTNIREGLENEGKKRVAQELDDQVLDALIAGNDAPVPPSMLEAWLASGLQDMRQRAAQMGREVTAEDEAEYREAAKASAERQIKGMFLLEAVRRAEEIDVTDEDINAKIEETAAEHGFDVEKYREFVEQGEEKDRLRHNLLERRTYDFLISRAGVTADEG